MRLILTLTTLFGCAGLSWADCGIVRGYIAPKKVVKVVEVVPELKVIFVPAPIALVPAYGAGYIPPTVVAPPAVVPPPAAAPVQPQISKPAPNAEAEALRQQLEVLKKELAELKKPKPAVQPAPTPEGPQASAVGGHNYEGVVATRCVKCHSQATAKDNGGSFVLTDVLGKAIPIGDLPAKKTVAILRKIQSEQMPPKTEPRLSEAEKAVFPDAVLALNK